jgi:telomerase reverse transcriptase
MEDSDGVDVKTFISCRRYETLTLHHILQGFSTSDCDWLMPPGQAAQQQSRVSVTDALKRRELLEEFIFWYFTSFLLPLLKVCRLVIYMTLYWQMTIFVKTTFYVTETSAFRNQVLYFRHDDWEILCAPLVDRLTSGTFERMAQVIMALSPVCFGILTLVLNWPSLRQKNFFDNENWASHSYDFCRKRQVCDL